MVDAIIKRNIALILTVIILRQKGLARAQVCSNLNSYTVVQKCPVNREEWEKASKKKNCSEIQKYDNCRNVEYHCLVNEFRNETVEVCTDPWYLQGYCPIYLENEVRNDYTKVCMNNAYPCNCSNRYRSTEAYKWQCCYNVKNISSGNQNIIVTDSDKYSNLNTLIVAVWTLLAIILLFTVLCAFGFVYQMRLECKEVCITSTGKNTEDQENYITNVDGSLEVCITSPGKNTVDQENYITNVDGSLGKPEEKKQNHNIGERVRDLVKDLDTLKKEIDQIYGTDILDLEYKLKSTEMKITNMYRKLFESTESAEPPLTKASTLEPRVTEISNIIDQMLQKLRALGLDVIVDDLKHHVSKRRDSHDKRTTEPNDDNTQKTEEVRIQMLVPQQTRLSKRIVLVDDTNSACLPDEIGPLSEKKTFREKIGYLRDNIDILMENFEIMRHAYYGNAKLGNFQTLDDQLSDIEADVDVLSEIYGFKEIQGSLSGKCPEEKLEEMKSSFEKLMETFKQMETKIGKP